MKIRVGILGCGKIAQVRHIPEYAANPDAELRGYFSPNSQRAIQMAEKYGGKAYPTAEELIRDPEALGVEQMDGRCIYRKKAAETDSRPDREGAGPKEA